MSETIFRIPEIRARLARFDEQRIPFPKQWHLSDNVHAKPDTWQEIKPSNWQDLLNCVSLDNNIPHAKRESLIRSVDRFAIELEQIMRIQPSLWNAYAKGGKLAFATSVHDDALGECSGPYTINYVGSRNAVPAMDVEIREFGKMDYAIATPAMEMNALAHEIAHAIDFRPETLEKDTRLQNGLEGDFEHRTAHILDRKNVKEEKDTAILFSFSPLFQEAFSLDLYANKGHPVTEHIRRLIPVGGIPGCISDEDIALRYMAEVRSGRRAVGDGNPFHDQAVEDAVFNLFKWEGLRDEAIADATADKHGEYVQRRLPPLDTPEARIHENATKYAEESVNNRKLDAESSWGEIFARVVEAYYALPGQNSKNYPYPALAQFMGKFVEPVLDLRAGDTLRENRQAQLARIDRLINRPLKKMMSATEFKHYNQLRAEITKFPVASNPAIPEAQQILIKTMDRVAREIATGKQVPSQRSLF